MSKRCTTTSMPGLKIRVEGSAAAPDEWSVDTPPPLAANGLSHLWLGSTLSRWFFPDIVIWPEPVEIRAPPSEVWEVFVDFERYGEWNGFHRKMEIVDKPSGVVGLRMTVALGELLGEVVETSTIYCVDEQRHILVYGLRSTDGPSSMRVVWLESTPSGTTIFRSYDTIGGWPAHFSRGHIVRKVTDGFNEQHRALRDRVHALQLARAEAAVRPPRVPDRLGTCLVTGGSGFLGSHLVRMLHSLDGVTSVHIADLQPPQYELHEGMSFHKASIADGARLAAIFDAARPDTVFHLASLIDLRPGAAAAALNDAVNAQGTRTLLNLCKAHGTRRFVYTSTIECGYHANMCEGVDETTHPYDAHPSNYYQLTKIGAERDTLLAHGPELATVSCRPAHILGHGEWDKLVGYLKGVDVCFGSGFKLPTSVEKAAKMSMVWVENCALGHILAASFATNASVGGRAYYLSDFDENIVSIYRRLAGAPPPKMCLPYWLLSFLVNASITAHVLLAALSGGRVSVLDPMMGLHDGALAAAQSCTVTSARAQRVLGYESFVTRDKALEASQAPARPLVTAAIVADAIARAARI